MTTLTEAAKAALEPYVGPMVADTCVRATALSLGKSSDELGAEDLDKLALSIRKLLAPVAPASVIDTIISDLRRSAA